jgi:hypothetical protein
MAEKNIRIGFSMDNVGSVLKQRTSEVALHCQRSQKMSGFNMILFVKFLLMIDLIHQFVEPGKCLTVQTLPGS